MKTENASVVRESKRKRKLPFGALVYIAFKLDILKVFTVTSFFYAKWNLK
jgi:hypothetical protein